ESEVPGRLGRAIRGWATRLAYRAPDRVLTISHGVAEGLVGGFSVPGEGVRVVHNPIEVSRVRQLAQEANGAQLPSRFIVGCGRLGRQEGVELLLDSLALLH